jgi:hypothetical protein
MSRAGRAVSATNGAVAVGLVGLLASVALIARPSAPPGIAAFAPRAVKPITRAPLSQSAGSGGTGSCATDVTCARATPMVSPHATATPSGASGSLRVPSALQCYTWPDGTVTQTFDPQSPPCIAGWDGSRGNGGSTSAGVTGTTIRVAVLGATGEEVEDYRALSGYFNRSFMLYGRRLAVIGVPMGADSPEYQHAAAAATVEAGAFAAFNKATGNGAFSLSGERTVAADLAASRILFVAADQHEIDGAQLRRSAPYTWSYYPAFDDQQRALGDLYCSRLAGRVARHSIEFAAQARKLVLLVPPASRNAETTFPDEPIRDRLHGCGVTPKRVEVDSENAGRMAQDFAALNAGGYTTAIWYGTSGDLGFRVLAAASSVGWRPEWVIPGIPTAQSSEYSYGNAPADEARQIFGMAAFDKLVEEGDRPSVRAAAMVGLHDLPQAYHALLLLAAGIQAAGPRLSPLTFARGLRGSTFPNPGSAEPPTFQGRVGFADGGYAMRHDYAAVWYDPQARSTQRMTAPRPGAFCWLEGGRRWSPDEWPQNTDALFFDATKPCR